MPRSTVQPCNPSSQLRSNATTSSRWIPYRCKIKGRRVMNMFWMIMTKIQRLCKMCPYKLLQRSLSQLVKPVIRGYMLPRAVDLPNSNCRLESLYIARMNRNLVCCIQFQLLVLPLCIVRFKSTFIILWYTVQRCSHYSTPTYDQGHDSTFRMDCLVF